MITMTSLHSPTFRLPGAALLVIAALMCPKFGHTNVTVEQHPLVVAPPVEPNIMFIMDDSGSMAWQHMPGTDASWTSSPPNGLPHSSMNNDIRLRAANINTAWYDPTKTYRPWRNWDGSSWGNIDPSSAPYDPSGTVTSGNHNLRRTSYPDSPSSSNRDSSSVTSSSGRAFRFQGFYVHQGGSVTSNSNYKRFDFRWNSNRWEGRYCNWNTWGSGTSLSNCDYYVGNNTQGPFGRSMAQEVQNYANWFSYYRLRASLAKGAASQVFATLDQRMNVRVGYRTLHSRQTLNIPVTNDEGLFRDQNKKQWFERLFASNANSGTPLRQALGSVGEYYRGTSSNGPWGPAPHLSCRQNFAILTTDGYWNGNAAGQSAARADNDGDGVSNTLADVAQYYWQTDLRTDLPNNVPSSAANPADWQHMVTFGISIGEQGTLDPTAPPPSSWPDPSDGESAKRIDDLWHATLNSHGEFIVASNAEVFVQSLNRALSAIANRLGSGASLGANSARLEAGTRVYQAQYWSGNWHGDISAYNVNPTTGILSSTPAWRASQQIPEWSTRNILFHNPDGNTAETRLRTFNWGNLNTAQRLALRNSNVVNYLRGERSQEESHDGPFRDRASSLGDIVHSTPTYVAAPNERLYGTASFSGADAYHSFAGARQNRPPMIYAGANDGMLHAFNANTGEEVFAFIPNTVIHNGLATLSDLTYEHQFFVDGELAVADVHMGGGWKTVLVGTLGRGGRGIFALDITDPEDVQFLWEKNSSDIPALGNVLGQPVIAQVANGDWRVILGNGPNSSGGSAQLLMLSIANGDATVVNTAQTGSNGLSAVRAWDSNRDGFADTVYAGDLHGNVWRFSDLTGSPSTLRLFRATDASGTRQSITAAPLVGRNPDTSELWVFVGTGQYLNRNDLENTQIQSWYGLIDRGTGISNRNQLVKRNIIAEGTLAGEAVRAVDAGSNIGNNRGWVIDLQSPVNGAEGERMVLPSQFRGHALVGSTRIPDASDRCNPSGRGFTMVIDPFTGGRLTYTFFDITNDGQFTDADKLSVNGVLVDVSGIGHHASPNSSTFLGDSSGFRMVTCREDGSCDSRRVQNLTQAILESWREIVGN